MESDKNIELQIIAGVLSKENKHHTLFKNQLLEGKIFNLKIPYSYWKRLIILPFLFIYCFLRTPVNTIRSFSVKKYSSAAINFKNLFFLKYFHRKYFDIIHCHFGQNGLIGAFLKDCGCCKKLIITFHGTDITSIPNKYGKNMYNYMFSKADHITSGSFFIKDKIIKHGGKTVSVIPMGINSTPLITSKNRNTFLSVGRLVEVKGLTYAISAFKTISDVFPKINYNIIGNGPLYDPLLLQIRQSSLENRVFLLGEKSDSELETYFQDAIALIFPSIRTADGSEEGQGLVIQEAGIRGIPVIGTNTGGIPEGIKDGISGWIIPEKDSFGISEKMKYFLSNTEQMEKFGIEAHSFALEKYNNEKIVSGLLSTVYFNNQLSQ